mgnify:CR=1 FL=1
MDNLIKSKLNELNNLTYNYDLEIKIQYLDELINNNNNINELINIIRYNLVLSETNKVIKYFKNLIELANSKINFCIEDKKINISKLLLSNNKLFFINNLIIKIKISYNNALQYLKEYIDINQKNKSIFLTITFIKNIK